MRGEIMKASLKVPLNIVQVNLISLGRDESIDQPNLYRIRIRHEMMHTDYPIRLATSSFLGEDRTFYHQRLVSESARLFKTSDELDIEVLKLHEQKGRSKLSGHDRSNNQLSLTPPATSHSVHQPRFDPKDLAFPKGFKPKFLEANHWDLAEKLPCRK